MRDRAYILLYRDINVRARTRACGKKKPAKRIILERGEASLSHTVHFFVFVDEIDAEKVIAAELLGC